jgi:hypothetical protein
MVTSHFLSESTSAGVPTEVIRFSVPEGRNVYRANKLKGLFRSSGARYSLTLRFYGAREVSWAGWL